MLSFGVSCDYAENTKGKKLLAVTIYLFIVQPEYCTVYPLGTRDGVNVTFLRRTHVIFGRKTDVPTLSLFVLNVQVKKTYIINVL